MRTTITILGALVCFWVAPAIAASCPTRSGDYKVNGVSLHWEEHGEPSGAPLLLVHGFGESMSVWEPYVSNLCATYDVVLLDLRGHGHSTNPTNSFSFRTASDDVLALMDHLHHARFRALGVSGGALSLLHVATRSPTRIEALVLVGAAPYLPQEARDRARAIVADKDTMSYMLRFATRGDEQAKALLQQFAALASSVDDPAFTPPKLATITAPTLIVQGDRDEFFPVELALQLYRSIPNSYLRIYPNGGHEPIFEPAAVAEFSGQILDFFGGHWKEKQGPE